MYYVPIEGKLDSLTKKKLQSKPPNSANLGVYMGKEIAETVITKQSEGATCGHARTQIKFGPALRNSLFEAISTAFPNAKLLDSPERPDDSILLKISLEKIDVGFEYSGANAGCDRPAMDQGRISITLTTQIIKPVGQIINDTSAFEVQEKEHEVPPPTQTGILEKCLSRISLQYVEKIKKDGNLQVKSMSAPDTAKSSGVEEKLESLQRLLNKGLITQEEFDVKKKQILRDF
jgi:hypothetical protein